MKKLLYLSFFLGLFAFTAVQAAPLTTQDDEVTVVAEDGYVYVYLQNKCSHDVKYSVKYSGHGSSGTVNKGSKTKLTVQPGAKIYIDGEYFMEVEDADDGEIFVVCR